MVLIIVDIIIPLLNKILGVLFFGSLLITIRNLYYFIQTILTSTEDEPIKFKLSTKELIIFGFSVAYILSTIITGITL